MDWSGGRCAVRAVPRAVSVLAVRMVSVLARLPLSVVIAAAGLVVAGAALGGGSSATGQSSASVGFAVTPAAYTVPAATGWGGDSGTGEGGCSGPACSTPKTAWSTGATMPGQDPRGSSSGMDYGKDVRQSSGGGLFGWLSKALGLQTGSAPGSGNPGERPEDSRWAKTGDDWRPRTLPATGGGSGRDDKPGHDLTMNGHKPTPGTGGGDKTPQLGGSGGGLLGWIGGLVSKILGAVSGAIDQALAELESGQPNGGQLGAQAAGSTPQLTGLDPDKSGGQAPQISSSAQLPPGTQPPGEQQSQMSGGRQDQTPPSARSGGQIEPSTVKHNTGAGLNGLVDKAGDKAGDKDSGPHPRTLQRWGRPGEGAGEPDRSHRAGPDRQVVAGRLRELAGDVGQMSGRLRWSSQRLDRLAGGIDRLADSLSEAPLSGRGKFGRPGSSWKPDTVATGGHSPDREPGSPPGDLAVAAGAVGGSGGSSYRGGSHPRDGEDRRLVSAANYRGPPGGLDQTGGDHAAEGHRDRMGWLAAAHGPHDPDADSASSGRISRSAGSDDDPSPASPETSNIQRFPGSTPDPSSTAATGSGGARMVGSGMALPTSDGDTLTITPTGGQTANSAVAPDLPNGRFLITAQNADAPKSYDFTLGMPAGAKAVPTSDGGVDIIGAGGQKLQTIAAPWAKDAAGHDIPTAFTVHGDTLTQHVAFDENTLFPIIADPAGDTAPGSSAIADRHIAEDKKAKATPPPGPGSSTIADRHIAEDKKAKPTVNNPPGDGKTGDGKTGGPHIEPVRRVTPTPTPTAGGTGTGGTDDNKPKGVTMPGAHPDDPTREQDKAAYDDLVEQRGGAYESSFDKEYEKSHNLEAAKAAGEAAAYKITAPNRKRQIAADGAAGAEMAKRLANAPKDTQISSAPGSVDQQVDGLGRVKVTGSGDDGNDGRTWITTPAGGKPATVETDGVSRVVGTDAQGNPIYDVKGGGPHGDQGTTSYTPADPRNPRSAPTLITKNTGEYNFPPGPKDRIHGTGSAELHGRTADGGGFRGNCVSCTVDSAEGDHASTETSDGKKVPKGGAMQFQGRSANGDKGFYKYQGRGEYLRDGDKVISTGDVGGTSIVPRGLDGSPGQYTAKGGMTGTVQLKEGYGIQQLRSAEMGHPPFNSLSSFPVTGGDPRFPFGGTGQLPGEQRPPGQTGQLPGWPVNPKNAPLVPVGETNNGFDVVTPGADGKGGSLGCTGACAPTRPTGAQIPRCADCHMDIQLGTGTGPHPYGTTTITNLSDPLSLPSVSDNFIGPTLSPRPAPAPPRTGPITTTDPQGNTGTCPNTGCTLFQINGPGGGTVCLDASACHLGNTAGQTAGFGPDDIKKTQNGQNSNGVSGAFLLTPTGVQGSAGRNVGAACAVGTTCRFGNVRDLGWFDANQDGGLNVITDLNRRRAATSAPVDRALADTGVVGKDGKLPLLDRQSIAGLTDDQKAAYDKAAGLTFQDRMSSVLGIGGAFSDYQDGTDRVIQLKPELSGAIDAVKNGQRLTAAQRRAMAELGDLSTSLGTAARTVSGARTIAPQVPLIDGHALTDPTEQGLGTNPELVKAIGEITGTPVGTPKDGADALQPVMVPGGLDDMGRPVGADKTPAPTRSAADASRVLQMSLIPVANDFDRRVAANNRRVRAVNDGAPATNAERRRLNDTRDDLIAEADGLQGTQGKLLAYQVKYGLAQPDQDPAAAQAKQAERQNQLVGLDQAFLTAAGDPALAEQLRQLRELGAGAGDAAAAAKRRGNTGLADEFDQLAQVAGLGYGGVAGDRRFESATSLLHDTRLPSTGETDALYLMRSAGNRPAWDAFGGGPEGYFDSMGAVDDQGRPDEAFRGDTVADRRAEFAAEGTPDAVLNDLLGYHAFDSPEEAAESRGVLAQARENGFGGDGATGKRNVLDHDQKGQFHWVPVYLAGDGQGATKLVDPNGNFFDDLDDFRQHNEVFSDDDRIVTAGNFTDLRAPVDVFNDSGHYTPGWKKALAWGGAIAGTIGGVALAATGFGAPAGAALVGGSLSLVGVGAASGIYLAGDDLANRGRVGQDTNPFTNQTAAMDYFTIGTSALGMAGGGVSVGASKLATLAAAREMPLAAKAASWTAYGGRGIMNLSNVAGGGMQAYSTAEVINNFDKMGPKARSEALQGLAQGWMTLGGTVGGAKGIKSYHVGKLGETLRTEVPAGRTVEINDLNLDGPRLGLIKDVVKQDPSLRYLERDGVGYLERTAPEAAENAGRTQPDSGLCPTGTCTQDAPEAPGPNDPTTEPPTHPQGKSDDPEEARPSPHQVGEENPAPRMRAAVGLRDSFASIRAAVGSAMSDVVGGWEKITGVPQHEWPLATSPAYWKASVRTALANLRDSVQRPVVALGNSVASTRAAVGSAMSDVVGGWEKITGVPQHEWPLATSPAYWKASARAAPGYFRDLYRQSSAWETRVYFAGIDRLIEMVPGLGNWVSNKAHVKLPGPADRFKYQQRQEATEAAGPAAPSNPKERAKGLYDGLLGRGFEGRPQGTVGPVSEVPHPPSVDLGEIHISGVPVRVTLEMTAKNDGHGILQPKYLDKSPKDADSPTAHSPQGGWDHKYMVGAYGTSEMRLAFHSPFGSLELYGMLQEIPGLLLKEAADGFKNVKDGSLSIPEYLKKSIGHEEKVGYGLRYKLPGADWSVVDLRRVRTVNWPKKKP